MWLYFHVLFFVLFCLSLLQKFHYECLHTVHHHTSCYNGFLFFFFYALNFCSIAHAARLWLTFEFCMCFYMCSYHIVLFNYLRCTGCSFSCRINFTYLWWRISFSKQKNIYTQLVAVLFSSVCFFLCLLALMNCIAAVFYQQTGTKIVAGFFFSVIFHNFLLPLYLRQFSVESHILSSSPLRRLLMEAFMRWTWKVVLGVWIREGLCWPLCMSSVFRHAETLNQVSSDLELNTSNRTSDGVERWAAEEHPGRPGRSVWHSWDNLGGSRGLGWHSQSSWPVRGWTAGLSAQTLHVCPLSLQVVGLAIVCLVYV